MVCVNERQLQRGQSRTIERRCNGESYAFGIEMSRQLLSGAIDHPRPEPMLIAHHCSGGVFKSQTMPIQESARRM